MKVLHGICYSKWQPSAANKSDIIGKWAEDDSEYLIIVPPQLRDAIVQFQNQVYEAYVELQTTEGLAAQRRERLERVFGPL